MVSSGVYLTGDQISSLARTDLSFSGIYGVTGFWIGLHQPWHQLSLRSCSCQIAPEEDV